MVFDGEAQGLDQGPHFGPGLVGLGGLVDVAQQNEVAGLSLSPEIRCFDEVLHCALGIRTVTEELEGVVALRLLVPAEAHAGKRACVQRGINFM